MQQPNPVREEATNEDWWWVFDPRLSLRARAAFFSGAAALLFTILLSWTAGAMFRGNLEEHLGRTFETLAFQVSDKLDRSLHERQRELQFAAGLPALRRAASSPGERRALLESVLDASRDFAWLGFVDPAGHVVTATGGLFEGTSVADRTWFRTARERAYAGQVYMRSDLAEQVRRPDDEAPPGFIDLALPVTGEHGQFLGVLGAHVHWAFARDVQLSVIPDAARNQQLGVTIYASSGEVLLDSGGSGWNEPPDVPLVPAQRRFRGVVVEEANNGTTYLTGYQRTRGFREYRGLGWLIVVRQPVARAFAPAHELRDTIMRWGFLFSGVLVVASWWAAGRLARRMRGVASTAKRIRHGDVLAVMPRPAGDSEMARMCGAVHEMVEDFRARLPAPPPAADSINEARPRRDSSLPF